MNAGAALVNCGIVHVGRLVRGVVDHPRKSGTNRLATSSTQLGSVACPLKTVRQLPRGEFGGVAAFTISPCGERCATTLALWG